MVLAMLLLFEAIHHTLRLRKVLIEVMRCYKGRSGNLYKEDQFYTYV